MNKKARTTLYKKYRNHVLNTSRECDRCGKNILYFCSYDADFCPYCNEWIDENCGDSNCPFCSSRPKTPGHALELCNILLEEERASHNQEKEKAMRHYLANEKHRKKMHVANKHHAIALLKTSVSIDYRDYLSI